MPLSKYINNTENILKQFYNIICTELYIRKIKIMKKPITAI